MTKKTRVRFAPSPTGALHIGGLRTALYNYLIAKKAEGDFLLRIEDTDQNRYIEGAEDYIREAIKWVGIEIDEGPEQGGPHAPYRQSERKDLYHQFAMKMLENGTAYYAFDTDEELTAAREKANADGHHSFKYGSQTRMQMNNSLSLSEEEFAEKLEQKAPYTVRMKVPADETIVFQDIVRGEVSFNSNELDDKVILKSDGLPTYHLANVVDDYHMEISDVVRGEEWLSSTAHHVLLYRALGWEEAMPTFSHLPLILKPTGKGKLSKRDGQKFGFPVFPLEWKGEDSFMGFREIGFLPNALVNFIALMGWHPEGDQELFTMDQLIHSFDRKHVSKAGARFDWDKAKWFNQQYLADLSPDELLKAVLPFCPEAWAGDQDYLKKVALMLQERLTLLSDFPDQAKIFFDDEFEFDAKAVRKKFKPVLLDYYQQLVNAIDGVETFEATEIKTEILRVMEANEKGFGDSLPVLRLGVSGTLKGPDIFEMMAILGKEKTLARLNNSIEKMQNSHQNG